MKSVIRITVLYRFSRNENWRCLVESRLEKLLLSFCFGKKSFSAKFEADSLRD